MINGDWNGINTLDSNPRFVVSISRHKESKRMNDDERIKQAVSVGINLERMKEGIKKAKQIAKFSDKELLRMGLTQSEINDIRFIANG